MHIRLCFENTGLRRIDDAVAFQAVAAEYLAGHGAEWAGFIMTDIQDRVAKDSAKAFEPLWQMVLPQTDAARRDRLLAHLKARPLDGYHVHVYQSETADSGRSVKLH